METLNEQIKREYGNREKKDFFDERQREELLHTQAALMRVAKKMGRPLSQREEMSINI